jgi:hypothetical protein
MHLTMMGGMTTVLVSLTTLMIQTMRRSRFIYHL